MANQWLRLWHEMPNDPKWRTIARIAGQPISLVQATYLHLLVDASRNVTRGHATVTHEDLASALDVTEDAISSVLEAMQSRVLDGMRLLGWDARQPKREDSGDEITGVKSAAQRKADQRAREKAAGKSAEVPQCHDASRNVTLDKEEKREEEIPSSLRSEEDGERGETTTAGEACKAMKAAGMQAVNPSHPQLAALLEAGVTVAELAQAAKEAAALGKPFQYALATAAGRRRDAAASLAAIAAGAATVKRRPTSHSGLAEKDYSAGITADGSFA